MSAKEWETERVSGVSQGFLLSSVLPLAVVTGWVHMGLMRSWQDVDNIFEGMNEQWIGLGTFEGL